MPAEKRNDDDDDDDDATGFLLRFHAVFALVAAIALRRCLVQAHTREDDGRGHGRASIIQHDDDDDDACEGVGTTVGWLVLAWHVGMLVLGVRNHPRIRSRYVFLLPWSCLMVLPDWFLVEVAGTLEFPNRGSSTTTKSWMIGDDAVLPAMAGMWSIPGLMILWTASGAADGEGLPPERSYALASAIGGTVLALAEASLPFVWTPTDRVRNFLNFAWGGGGTGTGTGTIAAYVLPAEFLLGPTLLHAYAATRNKPWSTVGIGTIATVLVYTGALAIGLLAFEGGRPFLPDGDGDGEDDR